MFENYIIFFHFRQMLFCRVTLGKSFLQFSTMKMAHAPPGHHSVIGRPSVNGLAYAEYVIYRGEQVGGSARTGFVEGQSLELELGCGWFPDQVCFDNPAD